MHSHDGEVLQGRSTRGGHGGFGRCTFFPTAAFFHGAALTRQQTEGVRNGSLASQTVWERRSGDYIASIPYSYVVISVSFLKY